MRIPRRLLGIALVAVLASTGGAVAAQSQGGSPGSLGPAFTPASGQIQFDSSGPQRVYDSRNDPNGELATGIPRQIFLPAGALPATAIAVFLNITVVASDPNAGGYANAFSFEDTGTSLINWNRPGEFANSTLVALAPTGNATKLFHVLVRGNSSVHAIVDLIGWLLPP
jgi:hypothetical protein